MFSKLVFLCLATACVLAAPAPGDVAPPEKQQLTVIPIVEQSEELEPNGTYKFSYVTGNGIKREEISYDKVLPKVEGRSKDANESKDSEESDEIHVQQGSYSYTAPDGTVITLRYIADENGFQPVGNHLPKAPSVPVPAGNLNEKSGRALKTSDAVKTTSTSAVVAESANKQENQASDTVNAASVPAVVGESADKVKKPTFDDAKAASASVDAEASNKMEKPTSDDAKATSASVDAGAVNKLEKPISDGAKVASAPVDVAESANKAEPTESASAKPAEIASEESSSAPTASEAPNSNSSSSNEASTTEAEASTAVSA